MAIGSVGKALEILPLFTSLFSSAKEWAEALYSETEAKPDGTDRAPSLKLPARELHQVCKQAEFAESDTDPAILATEPLLNLGKHYAKELPNLLMIGAKGAGKTFTYRLLVRSRSWTAFLQRLEEFGLGSIVDAAVFPVLWSRNIEDIPDGEIKTAQKQALDNIGASHEGLKRQSDLQKAIGDALTTPPSSWEDFWDGLIARQAGLDEGGLDALNTACVQRKRRILLVFDGIEDVFQDPSQYNAIAAIQALLQLPNRISELENRHLGALIFVRADYVQAAVRQNVAQLLQRFHPFRLHWNPESFLRLAYLLSCKADVIPESPDGTSVLRMEQLKEKLERLWGSEFAGWPPTHAGAAQKEPRAYTNLASRDCFL